MLPGVAVVLAVAATVAAAAWWRHDPAVIEIEIGGGRIVYHDFPDIIADLKGDGRKPRYVKLGIVVEVPTELRPRLEEKQSGIIDALHAYLRGRSAQELVGEEGAERVRGALSVIVNDALAPDRAKGVLFRQFILS
ncbi:MAG: flagellar basal body-associated FliL family protein [Rhodospirillales bacterium]|nr:flagellar basal body-associated FliL family protein [Rhodospirillales bacterium]